MVSGSGDVRACIDVEQGLDAIQDVLAPHPQDQLRVGRLGHVVALRQHHPLRRSSGPRRVHDRRGVPRGRVLQRLARSGAERQQLVEGHLPSAVAERLRRVLAHAHHDFGIGVDRVGQDAQILLGADQHPRFRISHEVGEQASARPGVERNIDRSCGVRPEPDPQGLGEVAAHQADAVTGADAELAQAASRGLDEVEGGAAVEGPATDPDELSVRSLGGGGAKCREEAVVLKHGEMVQHRPGSCTLGSARPPARGIRPRYCTVQPPSTTSTCPVTKLEARAARKIAAPVTYSGWA